MTGKVVSIGCILIVLALCFSTNEEFWRLIVAALLGFLISFGMSFSREKGLWKVPFAERPWPMFAINFIAGAALIGAFQVAAGAHQFGTAAALTLFVFVVSAIGVSRGWYK
ncbi:hypothetical protein [Kaistia algarum]|uniref:hypothetical protein n=1 Tax=Kaistia algarum TaxID=2083279 RepID=UPI0010570138|nr:hypothetical protein [Kaistia algarum]MCX5515378.1 hypothetical protein [Kaistia algarum]